MIGQGAILPLADEDRGRLTRTTAGLMAIGASLSLAIEQVQGQWVGAFIRGNALSVRQRGIVMIAVAIGVLGGLLVAAAIYLPARASNGLDRLSRFARLTAPLALLGFVPGLLAADAWPDTLNLCLALLAFVLGLEPLLRLHFGAYAAVPPVLVAGSEPATDRRLAFLTHRLAAARARLPAWVQGRGPALAVAAMALAYVVYMGFFVVRSHHRFGTYTWDLGQIDSLFYNMLSGHPFRSTPLIRGGNWSDMRSHAEVVVVFLLPLYALHPSAETLLVLQATLLGLGGIFLYRFAARRLPASVAALLTLAYYLYAPMHGAQFFDVHFQPIAAAFVLGAIDCFDARRMRLFALFFVLAITCREDISVGLAVFGLFLLLTGHRPRAGALIMAVSLAYFVLFRFVIMPALGPWGFAEHYRQLFPGEGPRTFGGIIKSIITNPLYTFTTLLTAEKLRYGLQILLPLAFLPLRRAHLAMSLLPGAYFTLLTTQYPPTTSIAYQYPMYFVPYVFPAAALALAALAARPDGLVRRRAAVGTLVIATLLTGAHWGAFPPRATFPAPYGGYVRFDPPTPEEIQRRHDIREVVAKIPPAAILAATDRELPHVSNRVDCWNLSTGFQGADYLLYTKVNPAQAETDQVRAAERAGYTVIEDRPGFLLYRRPGAP